MMERETVPSMTDADEAIHHSIDGAEDMEAVWADHIYVSDVFRNVLHHPLQLLTRWNWKTATTGAILRASFYYTVYMASRESWLVTLTAVLVELVFRFITTGIAGAVVQSFRRATPVWQANIIVSILLPTFSHSVEFATHYAQERYFADIFAASENSARQRTFAISVLFSVISVLFNLFAMRHGVLLVGAGEETRTLVDDFKKIPRMVGEFTMVLPVLICRYLESARFFSALAAFATFGIAVGSILGLFRYKWTWAWTSALGAWGILLAVVVITMTSRYVMRRMGKSYTNRY